MIATQQPSKSPMPAHIALNYKNTINFVINAEEKEEKVTGCLTTLSMQELKELDAEATLLSYGNSCSVLPKTVSSVELITQATGCFSAEAIEDDSFTAKLDTVMLESIQE